MWMPYDVNTYCFQTLVTLLLLFNTLGISAVCGVAVCIALFPVIVMSGNKMSVFQKKALVSTVTVKWGLVQVFFFFFFFAISFEFYSQILIVLSGQKGGITSNWASQCYWVPDKYYSLLHLPPCEWTMTLSNFPRLCWLPAILSFQTSGNE